MLFARKPLDLPTLRLGMLFTASRPSCHRRDRAPGTGNTDRIPRQHFVLGTSLTPPFPEGYQRIVVSMGCFWGAERMFWQAAGIHTTAVGYAGGITPNPSYEEVCSGRTGHTEVVLAVFDPDRTSFDEMLRIFWEGHDPTQGMRQGNDAGTQYRSAIYWANDAQREAAEASRESFQSELTKAGYGSITTEIAKAGPFYYAEDYHQQYLAKNPNGYCGLGGTGVACPGRDGATSAAELTLYGSAPASTARGSSNTAKDTTVRKPISSYMDSAIAVDCSTTVSHPDARPGLHRGPGQRAADTSSARICRDADVVDAGDAAGPDRNRGACRPALQPGRRTAERLRVGDEAGREHLLREPTGQTELDGDLEEVVAFDPSDRNIRGRAQEPRAPGGGPCSDTEPDLRSSPAAMRHLGELAGDVLGNPDAMSDLVLADPAQCGLELG